MAGYGSAQSTFTGHPFGSGSKRVSSPSSGCLKAWGEPSLGDLARISRSDTSRERLAGFRAPQSTFARHTGPARRLAPPAALINPYQLPRFLNMHELRGPGVPGSPASEAENHRDQGLRGAPLCRMEFIQPPWYKWTWFQTVTQLVTRKTASLLNIQLPFSHNRHHLNPIKAHIVSQHPPSRYTPEQPLKTASVRQDKKDKFSGKIQAWLGIVPHTYNLSNLQDQHFGMLRPEDHLSSGVQDQPAQHSKTSSLPKIQKLASCNSVHLWSQLLGRLKNNEEFGQNHGHVDGSGHLLGAVNTQTDVAIVVPNDNKHLEPGALASMGLLLYQHTLQNLILERGPQEKVHDLRFLDEQGEEIDFPEGLDLHDLHQAAQLGDGHPLLILGLASVSSEALSTAVTLAPNVTAKTSIKVNAPPHPRVPRAYPSPPCPATYCTGIICYLGDIGEVQLSCVKDIHRLLAVMYGFLWIAVWQQCGRL
ncbi:hypothetical protein AAY473_012868 [Plecturocebus cupreus]